METINDIASVIEYNFPDYGYVVVMFPWDAESQVQASYASNIVRSDAVRALKSYVDALLIQS